MIQKSKYTFLYHLFILKRLIYVLVSHKKSRTLQFAFFSFPLNLFITSAGITIHSSRQYFIIFDLLISPISTSKTPSPLFSLHFKIHPHSFLSQSTRIPLYGVLHAFLTVSGIAIPISPIFAIAAFLPFVSTQTVSSFISSFSLYLITNVLLST